MMEYKLTKDALVFYFDNPRCGNQIYASASHVGSSLTDVELKRICEVIIRQAQSKRPQSQRGIVYRFLRPLLNYFVDSGASFPFASNDWQIFILNFFEFYFTNTKFTGSSLETRRSTWRKMIIGVFEFWVIEGIMPYGVKIPRIRKNDLDAESKDYILGEEKEGLEIGVTAGDFQKLVVNIDFGKSSADYLESIEWQCKEVIGVIKTVCQNHWAALMRDGELGKDFYNLVNLQDLDKLIIDSDNTPTRRRSGEKILCSNKQADGHILGVALARRRLEFGDNQFCISKNYFASSILFPKNMFQGSGYEVLRASTAMPVDAFCQLNPFAQFYRFVGVMSVLDVAVACCLLLIEHPQFAPESLQNAKILNVRGKSHLILTDNGHSSILSLDKPRARKRSSVVLTPVAQDLLEDILEWTEPVRKILRDAGDKGWRYLFLGHNQGGKLGAIDRSIRLLTGRHTNNLTRLYPMLADVGLSSGTFDFRRIRTTMGVIRWFETGSIQEMSRRLGNTNKVVIDHYLPPALLRALNTRIIRRFQNMLIILAAGSEDYLLEVTDFYSISDLQRFIAQLVLEYPIGSSPLANEIQSRISASFLGRGLNEQRDGSAVLNVRLSELSLSYLYAYSDFVTETFDREQLHLVDLQTRLAPIQFVDLARLIKFTCENDDLSTQLREMLDVHKLRELHIQAVVNKEAIGSHFNQLSISQRWEE
jgi:hypothetical protein